MGTNVRVGLISAIFAVIATHQLVAEPVYSIQHISGLQDNFVVRISDAGHIVAGRYFWHQGTLTDLVGLGGNFTSVEGVNASGQVVGRSRDTNGFMRAFIWQNGNMTALPNLGGEEGFATAINNSGQIVGYTDNLRGASVANHRATFWTSLHVPIDIGTVSPDFASRAHAINNIGQAAGVSLPSLGSGFGQDAFFWDGTSLTPFIHNRSSGFAVNALNDLGQVVGYVDSTAFVWQNGVMVNLGTLGGTFSAADGINNVGQIVGRSTMGNGALRAFFSENGQMVELGSLVEDLSSWAYLRLAYDINESGQIVGVGRLQGGFSETEVFLLTPIRKPPVILDASVDPLKLWPPNHKMVTVNIMAVVESGSGNATWKVVEVECNEAFEERDVQIVDDHTVNLRATRSGAGNGRTYTIWIRATDTFGNESDPKAVTATVSHDQRK